MAVRCNVTASQASFSNVIGEPGHTKPQAARTTPERKLLWFVLGVRFSVHGQKGCQRLEKQVI